MSETAELIARQIMNGNINKKSWGTLIYNVKEYGAKGNGIADDTVAIQAAVDDCAKTGGTVVYHAGTYLISRPIVSKINTYDLDPTLTDSDLHFTDIHVINHTSTGKAVIKAIANMDQMFQFTFDSTDSDVSPYYSTVEGLQFNGNNLANAGIFIEWALHITIEKCQFHKLQTGIRNFGYGVHQILYNVFKCDTGISFERGGDNLVYHNDFFPKAGGTCISLNTFGGNSTISTNVFTDQNATGTSYGVQLRGDSSVDGAQEIRDVIITGNEFSGIDIGVYGLAHATVPNIYNCIVENNHVNQYGTKTTCCLGIFNRCTDFIINKNYIGGVNYSDLTRDSIEMVGCARFDVTANKAARNISNFAILTNSNDNRFTDNYIRDYGKTNSSEIAIVLFGSSSGNQFESNKFQQTNVSYGQYGIAEFDTSNANTALRNTFENMSIPYTKLGSTSVMKREEYGTAAPTSGAYNIGDIVWNRTAAAGGTAGWICTTAGSPGTWKTFATITA